MSTVHTEAYVEVGAVWFPMQGFRPAVITPPHRHDEVDPSRLVPALDADLAFAAKVPPSIVAPELPLITATLPRPIWEELPPPIIEYPCNCIMPDPTPTQVPLEAGTAALLLCALTLLYGARVVRAACRFGDWFTAERGTGPGKNGWVG